ncbi:Exonuclease 1 [Apostasia shenzhenica]|uniref:Exonuclease 1 n=1 Tax=Apostasia shenzhenica TaxID=1088818 RepID=A0A2I0AZN6_9ASPA|nr:Exonuclease 1 [Apostasia shenzhenica]
MEPIHAQDLRGQTVAVDTYSWLHKGAISCSLHLCKGLPTTRHIDYCMHRVNLLRHHGAKPILVFDGGLLPMKNDQEMKRARVRKENLERALEHEAAGNSVAAFDCYQKAVDISPSIAFQLIRVLKQENVEYIVAPYEADAQMTFLSIYNHVDAVITEDSDLIPFGCSRIIFKMDKFGQGVEFQSSKIEMNKDLDFRGFTKQMILEMCILSGCDYLPSLPGMGLKRAHALIRKHRSYDKVIKHLRYSGVSIPPHYEESYRKAVWAFLHQTVFVLQSYAISLTDHTWLPPDVVKGIAKGDLDPVTKMPFKVEDKLPNGCNRLWEFSLNGSSRQESNHDFAEPLLKSHEENGTKLNSRSSANKETVKRKAITRSPFFHSDSLLEDAIGDENGVSCSRDDESVGELIQHNFPEASIKKKKADNLHDVSILKSNAAYHDQGKRVGLVIFDEQPQPHLGQPC